MNKEAQWEAIGEGFSAWGQILTNIAKAIFGELDSPLLNLIDSIGKAIAILAVIIGLPTIIYKFIIKRWK